MSALVADPIPVEQRFLFDSVSWEFYDRVLHELDGLHYRISFDNGKLEIMTLGNLHERIKSTARRFVEWYVDERNIPITPMGSVTCRREDLLKGLEPDECYYVNRVPPPVTPGELDLGTFPAPDLAIEVDITSSSLPRIPIYGALNVSEILLFTKKGLTSLHRQADGTYRAEPQSLAFPDLPLDVLDRFARQALDAPHYETFKAFQRWIREHPPGGN